VSSAAHPSPVPVTALGGLTAHALLFRHHGVLRLTVIAKATFAFTPGGAAALALPAPIAHEEIRFDNSPMRTVRAASDLVPYRPAVDVTAVGHACAPAGHPTSALSVRLALYRGTAVLDKTVHVFGDRAVSAPTVIAPFERIPLRYERAYGGLLFEKNPLGIGAGRDAVALPNLVSPVDPTRVAGFGPISRYGAERRKLLGDAPKKRAEGAALEVPDSFAWDYFHSAPEDQRIPRLHGDEWLILDGMHPLRSRLQTQLPGLHATARVYPGGADPIRDLELVADTLTIDADAETLSLVWRGAFPLRGGEADLPGLRVAVAFERPGAAIAWPTAAEIRAGSAAPAPLDDAAARPAGLHGTMPLDWPVPPPRPPVPPAPPPPPVSAPPPIIAAAPVIAAPPARPASAPVPTLWRRQAVWRGDIDPPDRLRIERRDGTSTELRLELPGPLRLGRIAGEGTETNELVVPEVASRFAATLRHDGIRWWLRRRDECSVPVEVGARQLGRGEEAPLVHAVPLVIGDMHAVLSDRRYLTPAVAAGTVDPATGLLGRAGLELEIGCFLEQRSAGAMMLVRAPREDAGAASASPIVLAAMAVHRRWPTLAVGLVEGTFVVLAPGRPKEIASAAVLLAGLCRGAGLEKLAHGTWSFAGEAPSAAGELELALSAMIRVPADATTTAAVNLRDVAQGARITTASEVLAATTSPKRTTLLFAVEEQSALREIGPQVVEALESELAAVVAGLAPPGSLVASLAPGVVAACVPQSAEAREIASHVQCDWHARPAVTDGLSELPRSISWEILHKDGAAERAAELSREHGEALGVLSALSGGLPYPIAGSVHAAISASSAIERVKMLFDVLESTWRFMAKATLAAVCARPDRAPESLEPLVRLAKRLGTRAGYPLGTWREIARTAAGLLDPARDPFGATARAILDVKLGENQTFETLSNLMQSERNGFAHGQYNEARATADLPEFEQMTRTFLRSLRPLRAWTLVTVEKTDPDPYGDAQTVDYLDHTGPFDQGVRRRIGLSTPVRLANVVYLVRWREGLMVPLEPLVRRVAQGDRFDLYWMDHLPRPGKCHLSAVIGVAELEVPYESLRIPAGLRALVER
jgi:hypothetical protein